MNDRPPPPRDLMAPDTEPTDAELELVMREACAEAVRLESVSDGWIAARLREAAAAAAADRARRQTAEPVGD